MAIKKVNGTLIRVATFAGGMRKHDGYRAENKDRGVKALDAAASVNVAPSIPGNSYKLRRGFPNVGPKPMPKGIRFSQMRMEKVSK